MTRNASPFDYSYILYPLRGGRWFRSVPFLLPDPLLDCIPHLLISSPSPSPSNPYIYCLVPYHHRRNRRFTPSMTVPPQVLSMPATTFDNSTQPPSIDCLHARDASSASSSSQSPLQTTPEPLLPSSSVSVTSLPGYSASLPVPDYHPNPTEDERRLEFVPTRSLYGRSTGVWSKRIKDMTISLHNQDPIQVQVAPRYGRGGIIGGTIEFDEENLPAFEKVKLVVRLSHSLRISAGNLTGIPFSLRGKYRLATSLTKDAQKFSSAKASRFGESLSSLLTVRESSISKSRSPLSNRGGAGSNDCHPRTFATSCREEGSPAPIQCT